MLYSKENKLYNDKYILIYTKMNEKYKAYSLGNNFGTEYPITTVNTWIIDKASIVPINTATLISQNKKIYILAVFHRH